MAKGPPGGAGCAPRLNPLGVVLQRGARARGNPPGRLLTLGDDGLSRPEPETREANGAAAAPRRARARRSLALNAALLWGLALIGAFDVRGPVDPARVALAPLSAAQWDSNRAVSGPRPSATPPADEPAEGRVVELSPEQKAAEKPPAHSKFLSDRNTRVEKETVSRHAGVYPRVAPRPEPGAEGKAAAGARSAARRAARRRRLGRAGTRGRAG